MQRLCPFLDLCFCNFLLFCLLFGWNFCSFAVAVQYAVNVTWVLGFSFCVFMLRFGIGAFAAASYRLLCVQTAVLGKVKGAIKKIYAELVSITGYASPCKWGNISHKYKPEAGEIISTQKKSMKNRQIGKESFY